MSSAGVTRRGFVAAAAPMVLGARAKGANDRIAIGVIGTGGRGQHLITELEKCRDYNIAVTGVCDIWRPNREKGAAMAEKALGAKPRQTVDYQELLGWDSVDAVLISAPDFWHSVMLKAAVEAGEDAYCEKPMGTDFAEAKAAYLAVKRSGRVVQIGTQRRSDPYYVSAARHLHAGVLGKVTRAESVFNFHEARWARPYADVRPEDVAWEYFLKENKQRPFDARRLRQWQLFSEFTSGIAGLWMSHLVDVAHWFSGQPYPKSAVTQGGVYLWKDGRETCDVFYSLLEYPRDFLFCWSMNLTNSAGSRDQWFGSLGILDMNAKLISGEGSADPNRIREQIKLEPAAVNSHMANFLECVRGRRQPRADIQAGFSHAVAGIMSARALRERRLVSFDEERLEIA